jgi:uncharacterized membrane protein YpjA
LPAGGLQLNNDWTFWIGVVLAALVRVATSPFHSIMRAVLQIAVSLVVAWIFTDAVVDYLHLNPAIYRVPMGALLALTADGVVRAILSTAGNPKTLLSMIFRRQRDEGDE